MSPVWLAVAGLLLSLAVAVLALTVRGLAERVAELERRR